MMSEAPLGLKCYFQVQWEPAGCKHMEEGLLLLQRLSGYPLAPTTLFGKASELHPFLWPAMPNQAAAAAEKTSGQGPQSLSSCDSCSHCSGAIISSKTTTTTSDSRLSLPVTPIERSRSGDVIKPLHFYSPPAHEVKPRFIVTEQSGVGYKNYDCTTHCVLIRDLRLHRHRLPSSFSLSTHAFQLLTAVPPPRRVNLSSNPSIQAHYYSDATNLILTHVPGAHSVVIFDHTIRRASASQKLNRPVRKVHIDQTPYAALLRARRHLDPATADAVVSGALRLRIINVWRPLRGPVSDHPLCVAESTSVRDEDLIEVDHVYEDRVGQTYAANYNPGQRFWYYSNMDTSQAWLIQCFDSVCARDDDGVGRRIRCAHASFELSDHGEVELCERESIEIRCLVLGGELQGG